MDLGCIRSKKLPVNEQKCQMVETSERNVDGAQLVIP